MDKEHTSPSQLHAGHRQRLKDKIEKFGVHNMPDHEVLEFILGYCIPYRDTNGMSHQLISKFGSFDKVFGQDIKELCKVNGIQKHTALFLHALPKIALKLNTHNENKAPILDTSTKALEYFYNHYLLDKYEVFYIFCLDAKNRLIKVVDTSSSDPAKVEINLRYITSEILPLGTAAVIIIHTHPSGIATPSKSDLSSTKKILTLFEMLNIRVHDHIIVAGNDSFSFRSRHLIDQYKEESMNVINSFASNNNDIDIAQDVAEYYTDNGTPFDESMATED